MRKIVLGMAVAATALATPALARDGEGYFGADIGYTDVEAHKIFSDNIPVVREKEKDGYELGAFIGYDWGRIRTEAEVAYLNFNDRSLTNVATKQLVKLNGSSHITTAMANALLDLGGQDGGAQARIRVRIAAAHTCGNRDFADHFGEGAAALGVGSSFLVLNRRPFRMTGHYRPLAFFRSTL